MNTKKGNWCRKRKVKALFLTKRNEEDCLSRTKKIREGTTFSTNALTELQARPSDLN